MSTPTARETLVERLQGARNRIALLFMLGLPLAFLSGTAVPEPASAAVIVGVFASWGFGLFIVAPKAGEIAKKRFLNSLAHPSPEDDELMFRGAAKLVEKMAFLAGDEGTQDLFNPFYDGFTVYLDKRYDATMLNIASQRERGAGAFDPSQYSDAELNELAKQEIAGKMGGILDPILTNVGFSDRGKQVVHAKAMLAFENMGGNGGIAGRGLKSPSQLPAAENPYASQYR